MGASKGADFLTGWRDGTRAARSELDRRLRRELPAFGLTLDVCGRIVRDPGIPSPALDAPRPRPREEDRLSGAYRRGREEGWHATWQDGLVRHRAELRDLGLSLAEDAGVSPRAGHSPLRAPVFPRDRWVVRPRPGRAGADPLRDPPDQSSPSVPAPHISVDRPLPGEETPRTSSRSVFSWIRDVLQMVIRQPNRRATLVTLASGILAAGGLMLSPFSGSTEAAEGRPNPPAAQSGDWVPPTLWDVCSREVRTGLLALDRHFHELERSRGFGALEAEVASRILHGDADFSAFTTTERVLLVRWVRDRERADLLPALLGVYDHPVGLKVPVELRRAVAYTLYSLSRRLGEPRIPEVVRTTLETYLRIGGETDRKVVRFHQATLDILN